MKGRERKLGRALTAPELEELQHQVQRSARAGVAPASVSAPTEAARAAAAAVAMLPAVVGGLDTTRKAKPAWVTSRRIRTARLTREVGAIGELLRKAIAEKRVTPGPQLPPFARRTSALYVQQDDLEDFIPDGWGRRWPVEGKRLARQHGLPPLALPLLCLVQWASTFRPAMPLRKDRHECGAGFQVSLDWLARKMGCTREWVMQLINVLDPFAAWRRESLERKRANRRRVRSGKAPLPMPERPQGTALIQRFRRLKRYEDTCDAAAKKRIWVDSDGRPHAYVDVRGVCYLTSAGRAVLGRHSRAAEADVHRRGIRTRWTISARLRRGHHILGGHAGEVLEIRRELVAAPALPEDLPPNHIPLRSSPGTATTGRKS